MYPGIDLRLQRFVVAVAEELSFSAAAKRLHVAQPPLSRAIRQLENEIGFPLFIRSTRKVELTDAGREFVYQARKALYYAEKVAEMVDRAKTQSAYQLIIGYPPQFDARFITDLCKIRIAAAPQLRIETKSSCTAEILARLKDGSFAAGIIAMPDEYPEVSRLRTMPLSRYPIIAALPASHPLAQKQILSIGDLKDVPLIVTAKEQNPAMYDWFQKQCRKAGFTPRIARQVREPHEFGAMLFFGAGIGIGVAFRKDCPIARLPDNIVVRPFRETNLAIETAVVFGELFKSGPLKAFPAAVRKCWENYRPGNEPLSSTA